MINCDREDCMFNEFKECQCQSIDIDENGNCKTFSISFDDSVEEQIFQNIRDGWKS